MTGFFEKRRCPYCGATIQLARCPIVATDEMIDKFGDSDEAHTYDAGGIDGKGSGARQRFGKYSVLANPPAAKADESGTKIWRHLVGSKLPSASQGVPRNRLPARACYECKMPLPRDLDDGELITIGLVGTTRAGKSHYLASLYVEAVQERRGRAYGITEFTCEETTGRRLEEHYYVPLYLKHEQLEGTDPYNANVEPFSFRVSIDGSKRFALLLHDAAGESFSSPSRRIAQASYLGRADAVVFLVDPFGLPEFRKRANVTLTDATYENQSMLLETCLEELRQAERYPIPLAVVLSKSDAVARVMGSQYVFNAPSPNERADLMKQAEEVSTEVQALLDELGGDALLDAARQLPDVSFHAVAAIGSDPRDKAIPELAPRRCFEPLASVLASLNELGRLPIGV